MDTVIPHKSPAKKTKKQPPEAKAKKKSSKKTRNEKQIDEILTDSFPASDPPPWRP